MIVIKKLISILIAVLIAAFVLASCGSEVKPDDNKLNIITTIFPYYDFTSEIAGDKAEVTQLISPGAEIHDFEPTPKDILKINNADLFIYNGGESDEWVDGVLESIDSDVKVMRMFNCADLLLEEDIEHKQGDEYDEHIWTSLSNVKKFAKAICDEVSKLDKENADYYKYNAEQYEEKIAKLDTKIKDITAKSSHNTMVVADRFPLLYFAKEYGISFESAFPGCSSETQPSVKTVTKLIDFVRQNNIPVVFHIDNSSEDLARSICEDSSAKIKTFYSLHNITAEQFKNGESYISLMELNTTSLKEALG